MKRAKSTFIFFIFCALCRSPEPQSNPPQNTKPAEVSSQITKPADSSAQAVDQVTPQPTKPKPDLTKTTFLYDNKEFKPDGYRVDLADSHPGSLLTFTQSEVDHLESMLVRTNVSTPDAAVYIYAQIYPVGKNIGLFRFYIPAPKLKLDIGIAYHDFLNLKMFCIYLHQLFDIDYLDYHYDFVAALMFFMFLPEQDEASSQVFYNIIRFLALCSNTVFVGKIIKNIPKGNRKEVATRIISMIDEIVREDRIRDLKILAGIGANKDVIMDSAKLSKT